MAAQQPTVLLVDDDAQIVRAGTLRLRAAGYDVITAHNGRDGLAAALAQKVDAIVLDIRMPVMDGLTMLAELQGRPGARQIPVIVLSANVAKGAKSRALDLGAYCFMEKPYEGAQLVLSVRSALIHAALATSVLGNGECTKDG